MMSSQYWEGWHDLFNREMWGRGVERAARAMKEGYWSCPEVSKAGMLSEAENCRINEDSLQGSSAHLRPLELEGQKKSCLLQPPRRPRGKPLEGREQIGDTI